LLGLTISAALWAQKQTYTTGSLLGMTDEYYAMNGGGQKHAYLFHIKGDSDDYFALYSYVLVFGKDHAKFLKTGDPIQFRIASKNLFIKTPDNKELKSSLCEKSAPPSQVVKCSGATFMGNVTATAAPK
jgi:hypothetical protein